MGIRQVELGLDLAIADLSLRSIGRPRGAKGQKKGTQGTNPFHHR
jgi:hypothetical protein